jgi:hypothetical protein
MHTSESSLHASVFIIQAPNTTYFVVAHYEVTGLTVQHIISSLYPAQFFQTPQPVRLILNQPDILQQVFIGFLKKWARLL